MACPQPSPYNLQALPKDLGLDHQAQRTKLLTSLRGQTIRIPNMEPLFAHWPKKTNIEVDSLRADMRDWLNANFPEGNGLKALQASDFGLFGATWWPVTSFDKLRIVTYLAVWLFTWDDEIDVGDSTMWDEFGAAQVYREQTLAYVRYTLGLESTCPKISNRIILNFGPIGAALESAYTKEQNTTVYKEIEYFIGMSEQEQSVRLAGHIPTIDEFWHYRLGTSAVTVLVAFLEFSCDDLRLPAEFWLDEDVTSIIKYTNTIICAVNDLLSVKKEIERNAIDSLVPLVYYQVGDIQKAVDEVVQFVGKEVSFFDAAAERLIQRYKEGDAGLKGQVIDFIDGCKYFLTGNLTWSMQTARYGVEMVNGEIVTTF